MSVIFILLLITGCGSSSSNSNDDENNNEGRNVSVLYEDAEDESVDRWLNYVNNSGNASVENIVDDGKRVIKLNGTRDDFYMLDFEPDNSEQFVLEFDTRGMDKCIMVYAEVSTNLGGRYLEYTTFQKEYVRIGKFEDENGGVYISALVNPDSDSPQIDHDFSYYRNGWNHVKLYLQKDLQQIEPDNNITSVNSLRITGEVMIDNVMLSSY